MDVEVPEQTGWTPKRKADYCTEIAFNHLMASAGAILTVKPAMGLMYLSDLEVTKQFQAACRAVLRLQGAEF
jgi:hypothetical protein